MPRKNEVASLRNLWRSSSTPGVKRKIPLERLLRWRHQKAKADAPPAPSAAELIDLARPWWERRPEKFQLLIQRLNKIQVTYPQAGSDLLENWYPVPVLVVHGAAKSETSARVVSYHLRERMMHLRFQLKTRMPPLESSFEATFISEIGGRVLFTTTASVFKKLEFTIDTELPTGIARDWKELKVTDPMPFRVILFPMTDG